MSAPAGRREPLDVAKAEILTLGRGLQFVSLAAAVSVGNIKLQYLA